MKNILSNGLQTKHIILILGTMIIVSATIISVTILLRPSDMPTVALDSGEFTPIGNYVVDESNIDKIKQDLGEKVAKGMFKTYMNTTWNFPDGESASTDAVMGNSEGNTYPFWFDLTVTQGDEKVVVYTSSLLPVGSQLKEIILSKPLAKGKHNAVLTVHMVDENNEPVESNMGFSIELNIKN